MERLLTVGLVLVCFGHNLALDKTENVYFLIGGTITLRPPSGVVGSDAITGAVWRHNDNLAAEWSKGEPTVDIYRNFKGHTDLDTTTGYLVIRDMTEAEVGTYAFELNNVRLDNRYVVSSIERPPKPKVWVKPTTTTGQVELVCEGNVDKAGPVTYWWDIAEDRSWVQSDQRIILKDNETTQRMEKISCKIVSPVVGVEEQSQPKENPFFPQPGGNPGLGALALIPIALILVGVGIWKRKAIKNLFSGGSSVDAAQPGTTEDHHLK